MDDNEGMGAGVEIGAGTGTETGRSSDVDSEDRLEWTGLFIPIRDEDLDAGGPASASVSVSADFASSLVSSIAVRPCS